MADDSTTTVPPSAAKPVAEALPTEAAGPARPAGRCPNCGAALTGKYCADCGQKRIDEHDYSLVHFVAHSLHDLTHLDAKVFGSVVPLVTKPGLVTSDYLAGRRGRYLRPLQTFIILNLVFFFLGAQIGMWRLSTKLYVDNRPLFFTMSAKQLYEAKLHESGKSRELFTAELDEKIDHYKRSLLLALVPIFAGAIALLYLGSGRRYIEHLIFSIHFYSFWMIVTVALPLAIVLPFRVVRWLHPPAPSAGGGVRIGEEPLLLAMFFGCWIWLHHALRRVYGSSRWGAVVRALVLTIVCIALLFVFRDVVFLAALAAA